MGDQPESANVVKIAGNFMIASAIETMGEAVALTRSHGVKADAFLDILTNTLFAAPAYKLYGGMIAAEKYTAGRICRASGAERCSAGVVRGGREQRAHAIRQCAARFADGVDCHRRR